jgi:hypothetical protein
MYRGNNQQPEVNDPFRVLPMIFYSFAPGDLTGDQPGRCRQQNTFSFFIGSCVDQFSGSIWCWACTHLGDIPNNPATSSRQSRERIKYFNDAVSGGLFIQASVWENSDIVPGFYNFAFCILSSTF